MIDAPNHDDSARHASDVFPRAPAKIGVLLSVTTTRNPRAREERSDVSGRLIASASVMCVVMLVLSRLEAFPPGWSLDLVLPAFGTAALTFLALRPADNCTFVGSAGFATTRSRFGLGWSTPRVRLFDDADELDVVFTRLFGQGYRGTNFQYRWLDAAGRVLFKIEGVAHEHRIDLEDTDWDTLDELPSYHKIHFANAATQAWHSLLGEDEDTM